MLLKNTRSTLPLGTNKPVYVAGSNADNIGNQAGGWTLTWQGGSTTQIPGQTILHGIEADVARRHVQPGRLDADPPQRDRSGRGR